MNNNGTLFANYTQLPAYLSLRAWQALRFASIGAALAMAWLLWARPEIGLPVFWGLAVPVLPLVFFVLPGLWRNLCPLASTNQLPRLFGIGRGLTQSRRIKDNTYAVGIAAFFVLVTSRKLVFNTSGGASALLIVLALGGALLGGLLFKGKSGWCSSICPLLPVQRLYGQTPYVKVANTHCQPCVGCTKNCYDFNPGVAYLADQYDDDRHYSGYRRLFAGAFPGFVLGFYLLPNYPAIGGGALILQLLLFMAASLALFHVLDTVFRASHNGVVAVYAAAALNIYYWFAAPGTVAALHALGAPVPEASIWPLRTLVLAVSLIWIRRTWRTEQAFLAQLAERAAAQPAKVGAAGGKVLAATAASRKAELKIDPEGRQLAAQPGQSVLEAVEACGLAIESGCRMGVCGADPIAVTDGMEHLSEISAEEQATLERLGLAPNTRMACCARVQGPVTVELKPHRRSAAAVPAVTEFDREIRRVVVIGNGIGGITAADHVRRRHPECEIHVIGRERHFLYNRMGISRLIYGRSGMQGLYLLPESWYDEHNITSWLNTHVTGFDAQAREVRLATGETLGYDRLILATGSHCFVPPTPGLGARGSFVLREADEAMEIRDYVQQEGARHAVVVGAGLLGLEVAYALHKLGLQVTVLCNSASILNRQLDAAAGDLLRQYLEGLGMQILLHAQLAALETDERGRARKVALEDGRRLPCEVLLVCAGVRANTELAREAGLAVGRGIVVDEQTANQRGGRLRRGRRRRVPGPVLGPVASGGGAGRNRRHQCAGRRAPLRRLRAFDLAQGGRGRCDVGGTLRSRGSRHRTDRRGPGRAPLPQTGDQRRAPGGRHSHRLLTGSARRQPRRQGAHAGHGADGRATRRAAGGTGREGSGGRDGLTRTGSRASGSGQGAVQDLTGEQIGDGGDADVRVRPDVDALRGGQVRRAHVVEEDPRPDHPALPVGQGTPDREAAEIPATRLDDQLHRRQARPDLAVVMQLRADVAHAISTSWSRPTPRAGCSVPYRASNTPAAPMPVPMHMVTMP